ncbi:MAG: radical SAM protein [Myxococcales bacterium]|nr:radical SAM protein [Myxococcales bacterium]
MAGSAGWQLREAIRDRLGDEQGTIRRTAERRVALCYPSPYHVAMSSLGFQSIYRVWNEQPGWACERAFLPDDLAAWREAHLPLYTVESELPVGDADVVAFSVAFELQLGGLFDSLALSGLPVLASEREGRGPLVVAGGPLTFSNPLPLGPFVDVVLLGEGEEVAAQLLRAIDAEPDRGRLLAALALLPGFWVPSIHGERLGVIAACDDGLLPAYSQVLTPHTELSSMFLIEPERGCSRGCTYCVMRRSTNGGMRLVPPERVLGLVPAHARKVGLVGAAVTDHPRLPQILRGLVDSGRTIGISSLRADRLNDEIVGLLAAGGYRAITFASDGASERLRIAVERKTKERHLLAAAELAAKHRMDHVKVYQMIGLPGETDADIDELGRLTREMAKIIRVVLGIAPFVAKRNTPLDRTPFAGVREVEGRLSSLRRALKGRAEIRPTSARWAWAEYALAQGGMEAGLRALAAHRAGGSFAAWQRAFADTAGRAATERRSLPVV